MEHKGQLQPEKKSAQEEEEEEAMAMAASSPSFFFAHPLSLLHHVTRGFAGYMGLSRLCHALKDLKPRAATSSRLHEQGPGAGGAGHAADILEAREKLSQNLQHQTKLESNEDTVALTFSNADGTVLMPVEVVSVLKDQDAPGRPTALRNVDYGILEPIHLQALSKDTVSDAGAVASDKISSSVPLVLYSLCQYQKMPLISHNQGWKKAFTLPLKNMPLSSHNLASRKAHPTSLHMML